MLCRRRLASAALLALAVARQASTVASEDGVFSAATVAEADALSSAMRHHHHSHDMQALLSADAEWTAAVVDRSAADPVPPPPPAAAIVETSCQPRLAADSCAYVRTTAACQNKEQRVNYLELHYCSVVAKHRPEAPAVLLLGVWLLLVFLALILAAELYFAPAVANIARWLDLSDDVAGATLLAFGNGAPDFFTQVAAITYGEDVDLPLALGEGVGAGVYVICFCLACCLLTSKADPTTGAVVVVPRIPFIRDVCTYLAGLVMVLIALNDGLFTQAEAASLLLLYAFYVAAVLYGPRLIDLTHSSSSADRAHIAGSDGALTDLMSAQRKDAPNLELELIAVHTAAVRHRQQTREEPSLCDEDAVTPPVSPRAAMATSPRQLSRQQPSSPRMQHQHVELPSVGHVGHQLRAWFTHYVGDDTESSWPILQKVTAPVRLLLALTMADARGDGNHVVTPLHAALVTLCLPPLIGAVFMSALPPPSQGLLIASLVLRGVAVVAVAAVFPRRGVATADSALVSGIAFLGGLAWMDLCADEVVSIFQAMGRILNLPEDILGGTIMCWANSVGDLAGMLAVVRQGHIQMVVTSCFGGPCFQMLCGLGVGLLIASAGTGVQVASNTLDTELRVLFGFGIALMSFYLLVVPLLYKCVLTRRLATALMGLYVCFVFAYTAAGLRPVRG